MPRRAERRIINIGLGEVWWRRRQARCVRARMAKTARPFRSSEPAGSRVSRAKMSAVERISATVQGRTASRTAVTAGCLSKSLSTIEISRIIMKAGKITPSVATRAPRNPACEEPMNVAMLTASGPGVDSETAMKLTNSVSVSQPFASTVSRTMEIMPYPPPNETAPITKKAKKSLKQITCPSFAL